MRTQHVTISGSTSENANIIHGVPQGSVLGPLLFLICINDLHKAITHFTVHHFADDTNLVYINKLAKEINKYINHDLRLLSDWLTANKISLNVDKTELVLFRSKTNKINKHLNFRLSGKKIIPTTCLKYLGIYLDEHLDWQKHTQNVIFKLIRANRILSKLRHYVPQKTLITVYHSLFSSHLIYACQVWGQDNSQSINRIGFTQFFL